MKNRLRAVVGVLALSWSWSGSAHAQSAATCSFDVASGTLTVTVNGQLANLSINTPSIRLNNHSCGSAPSANIFNTDLILVNGGALDDDVGIFGTFAGGKTAEPVGASEVEIVVDLGAGTDAVYIEHKDGSAALTFAAGGIDALNDGDEDVTFNGVETVSVDDAPNIDARLYVGGATLFLLGSDVADTIYGSAQADVIRSRFGNDTLYGMGGNDRLQGGPGDDVLFGGDGNDRFIAEPVVDGNDSLDGGAGIDTMDYARRTIGVSVSVGNGQADDGQPGGELDAVDVSVENVNGGAGDDVIVGSSAANLIMGGDGDDELYGDAGRDEIHGGYGADILVGDAGRDNLYGDQGMDSIDGGIGNDNLFGGGGADTITCGPGTDDIVGEASSDIIFNGDGEADNVDCGPGAADDVEVDPLDTFNACEL